MTPNSSMSEALARGFSALETGDLATAENACRVVLTQDPNIGGAHFLIGLVALERGERRIAANAFHTATKLEPGHVGAWAHLAKLFSELGYTARADQALQKAETIGTEIPAIQNVLGLVNTTIGEHGKAADWYGRGFAASPHIVGYGVNLANAQNFIGDASGAANTIGQVLMDDPKNAQAHWVRAGLKRADDDQQAQNMLSIAADNAEDHPDNAFLYYGAGKIFEDTGQWASAFEAFSKGARAKKKITPFDETREEALFQTLHSAFDQDWMNRAAENAPKDNSPIFVIGQPRTGTTLIERIMTAHSQIHSAGELQQFYLSIRRMTKSGGGARVSSELMKEAADMDMAKLGQAYLLATRHHQKPSTHFVDKLPVNYLYAPLIAKALPGAKIIHVVRGPMDSCFSSYKQLFAEAYPHSYDLTEMARHHVRYRRLMQHWRDILGDRLFEISYEDTVHDLEANARALIDFLDLPWENACLNFHRQSSAVSTASAAQVREPAHTRSVGRWKHYAEQLKPVQDILETAGLLG